MSDTTNNDTTPSSESEESEEGMSTAVKLVIGAAFGVVAYKTVRGIIRYPRRVQLARRRNESAHRVQAMRETYGTYL